MKTIALVAHDNKKGDLLEWTRFNRDTLAYQQLYATGMAIVTICDLFSLSVQRGGSRSA